MALKMELKAQRESVISSVVALSNKENEASMDPKDPDTRSLINGMLDEMLERISEGEASDLKWASVCKTMDYDVYLAKKAADETVTRYDLIRPGLVKAQFSHEEAFKDHRARMDKDKESCTEMKLCSGCDTLKLANKFKKGGGSVCNACRMKRYRQRKAAE